jgi:PAS domain S-box-containing protein
MQHLFDLDFSRWEILLLFLLPALINLGLFIYTVCCLSNNKINHYFSLFVLVVGLWQLTEGLTRLNVTAEGAAEWFSVSGVFALFMSPFGLLFTLNFIDSKRRVPQGVIFLSQFIPAILASFVLITGSEANAVSPSDEWYWVLNTTHSFINYLIYIWISIDGLLIFLLLWWNWYSNRQYKEGGIKYALMVAIGFSIPFIGGSISEVVYPLVSNSNSLPITASLFTFFSIACLISIIQFNMLDYSPKHQWDQIVEKMSEGIIIVDKADRIMYANTAFCKFLGYELGALQGVFAGEFFMEGQDIVFEDVWLNDESIHCQLKSKSGEGKWMVVSGSPYLDKKDRVIGTIGHFTNIDHLKKAEARLFQNTERLKAIFDNEPECVMVVGINGHFQDVNPTGLDTLEVPDITQLAEQSIFDFIHADDLSLYRAMHEQVCAGENSSADFRIEGRNGTQRWMESNTVPLRKPDGEIYAVLSVCRDITEIKRKTDEVLRMKEYLEKSERGLRQAQKLAKMGSWEADMQMLEVHWSDEVYEIFGTAKHKTIPSMQAFLSFIHPADIPKIMPVINRDFEELKGYSFTCRVSRQDGTERFIYADCRYEYAEESSDPVRMYGIIHDITERMDTEAKLEQSKARLVEAQEIAHVGSWALNFETNLSTWSDEAYRIYGLDPNTYQMTQEDWFSRVHPDDQEMVAKEIERSAAEMKGVSMEHRIIRKDGVTRYVNSESRYEFDETGKPVGLVGTVHDITEHKSNEIRLHKLLELTNDQNKRLQNFTYIVSHNIRSHSANISGLIDHLSEEVDNDEVRMLKSSSDKLAETIHNLNSIIAIQTELDKERVQMNLKSEVEKTLQAISSMVSRSKAEILIDIPSHVYIVAVPSYMESILLNLLTNALKYRSPDRIPKVRLSIECAERHIILSMTDNGIGINLEKYGSSMFGMYKTFHNNEDAKGLGLFIVKNQIEAMNGKIEVESQPDKGSTFRVYFCRGEFDDEMEDQFDYEHHMAS